MKYARGNLDEYGGSLVHMAYDGSCRPIASCCIMNTITGNMRESELNVPSAMKSNIFVTPVPHPEKRCYTSIKCVVSIELMNSIV